MLEEFQKVMRLSVFKDKQDISNTYLNYHHEEQAMKDSENIANIFKIDLPYEDRKIIDARKDSGIYFFRSYFGLNWLPDIFSPRRNKTEQEDKF